MHHHEPDAASFDWNEMYRGDEQDYMPPTPRALELLERLPVGSALDVGCGAGGLVAALAERGWDAAGVDIAPNAIAAAKTILAARGLEAELHVGDATTWAPPRTYDLVTNTFALPMKRGEQLAAYATIRRAVAPGGIVYLEDFDPQMSRVAPFRGIDLVSVEQLREAFDGFEILRAEVVPTPAHDHGQGAYGEDEWTAALLIARRPT